MLKLSKSILAITLFGLLSQASAAVLSEQELTALLSHPDRPADDAARDAARKPAKVMAFTGISNGDHVLDLFAGSGWYTELFSRAVGDEGKVYAQNDSVIWQFSEQGMEKRTRDNRLANVERLDAIEIADMEIAPGTVDIVFTALNYHDMFFTEFTRDGSPVKVRDDIVDYKAALARVKDAMADDAVFIIIDHSAHPGSGYDAANSVHRIDADIVKFQMNEAGFTLIEEAFYLRNPDDDKNKNVFDPSIRGKTDRFIYKFMKTM